VTSRTAQAVLSVDSTYLARLKRMGKFSSSGERDQYNLAEVLEHYRLMLQRTGQLAQEIEAICIREFRNGKHPEEVLVEHAYPFETVKMAWDHHHALVQDPHVLRLEAERAEAAKKEEATRCRACLRTETTAREDNLRVVRETTGEPLRESFTLLEERVFIGIDIRCPSCHALKATAPVEGLKARLRALAITGLPKPIDVDKEMPLPVAPPVTPAGK
jgi:hypothetical protein